MMKKKYLKILNAIFAHPISANTMNIMTIDNYKAKIEYDADIDMFRGEILGLNGGADFYGNTTDELHLEFQKSLNVFLEVCREKGIEPQRSPEFNKQHYIIIGIKSVRKQRKRNQSVATVFSV